MQSDELLSAQEQLHHEESDKHKKEKERLKSRSEMALKALILSAVGLNNIVAAKRRQLGRGLASADTMVGIP